MIDIHNHLLYNVDDGVIEDIESITSIGFAEEAGFTDIILTPHYIEDYYENDFETIEPKVQELQEKLNKRNINVKLHHGNEVYITENMGNLIKNNIISKLGNSRYVLFELPQKVKALNLDDVILDIKLAGCIPVLAHPERYLFVQQNPNVILELIEKEVLMQCNYGSLIGQYGKPAQKTIAKLLKANMVHFLGTDTHRQGYIYAHFYKVEKELKKYINKEKMLELTTTNPQKILNDEDIIIEKPKKIRKKFLIFA